MKKLLAFLIVLIVAFSGYWFFAAGQIEQRARDFASQAAQNGWGDAEAVSVSGYPLRFDLTVRQPDIAPRGGRFGWHPDWIRLSAPSYAPNKITALMPDAQNLTLGGKPYTLKSDRPHAALNVALRSGLPLREASVSLERPQIASTNGEAFTNARNVDTTITAQSAQDGAIGAPDQVGQVITPAYAYHVDMVLNDLELPTGLLARLLKDAPLANRIEQIRLDATLGTKAPLDQNSLAVLPPVQTLRVDGLNLMWDGKVANATGALAINDAGQPEGELTFSTPDWKAWLEVAVQAGIIPQSRMFIVQGLLGQMVGDGDTQELSLPLTFRAGQMKLGPLPLGPAPVIQPSMVPAP